MKRSLVYLAVLSAIAVMSGCASMPSAVNIPVAVPCKVTLPAAPVWATETLLPDAGIWPQVQALLAERQQRIGYIIQLEAAARSCQ
jgi:hypothetical protein